MPTQHGYEETGLGKPPVEPGVWQPALTCPAHFLKSSLEAQKILPSSQAGLSELPSRAARQHRGLQTTGETLLARRARATSGSHSNVQT